jgi:hypothetical protein
MTEGGPVGHRTKDKFTIQALNDDSIHSERNKSSSHIKINSEIDPHLLKAALGRTAGGTGAVGPSQVHGAGAYSRNKNYSKFYPGVHNLTFDDSRESFGNTMKSKMIDNLTVNSSNPGMTTSQ